MWCAVRIVSVVASSAGGGPARLSAAATTHRLGRSAAPCRAGGSRGRRSRPCGRRRRATRTTSRRRSQAPAHRACGCSAAACTTCTWERVSVGPHLPGVGQNARDAAGREDSLGSFAESTRRPAVDLHAGPGAVHRRGRWRPAPGWARRRAGHARRGSGGKRRGRAAAGGGGRAYDWRELRSGRRRRLLGGAGGRAVVVVGRLGGGDVLCGREEVPDNIELSGVALLRVQSALLCGGGARG